MVYISSWDDFVEKSVQLFRSDPEKTRYSMKYRHCDGKLVLKVTDDKECNFCHAMCYLVASSSSSLILCEFTKFGYLDLNPFYDCHQLFVHQNPLVSTANGLSLTKENLDPLTLKSVCQQQSKKVQKNVSYCNWKT